jgi:hypothetical protein
MPVEVPQIGGGVFEAAVRHWPPREYRICYFNHMGTKNRKPLDVALDDPKLQAWRSPVQQELQGLFSELAAFNERIAELAKQGHRSLALNLLKVQALGLAGQIDEFRCLLVVPKPSR